MMLRTVARDEGHEAKSEQRRHGDGIDMTPSRNEKAPSDGASGSVRLQAFD